jgi:uroporphyrinogen decarboxylase
MTSKERLQLAFDYEEPDRVPMQVSFVPEVLQKLKSKYKVKKESSNLSAGVVSNIDYDIDIYLGHDMLILNVGMGSGYYREFESGKDTYTTEWGIRWEKMPYQTKFGHGYYTEMVGFPLAEDDAIDSYVPPNPENEDISFVDDVVKVYGKDYYICGDISCSILEAFRYLRGPKAFEDLLVNKEIAHKIMDMTVDYHLKLGYKLIEKDVDMIWLANDVGSEHSMLISPEVFREFMKPRLSHMIGEFKKKNKDIKVAWHSDGYILPILDDLVEIGLDVLNPIQPESMDPTHIKKRYGNNLCLWGTVSTQRTFPYCKPKDVENEVIDRIRNCAPGGGFLIAPTHNIQLDVPEENLFAFYNTIKKYGKYPISL